MFECYANIEAGLTVESLHDLTGAPTKSFYEGDDPNLIWQNILNGEKRDYVMNAGSKPSSMGSEALNKYSIAGGHAYSLLGGYEIMHNGQVVRLVKLRNPWGDVEWTGNWSDNSPLWNSVDQ